LFHFDREEIRSISWLVIADDSVFLHLNEVSDSTLTRLFLNTCMISVGNICQ